ncbi:hypothetical protein KEJ21_05145 [Candidatus Bathyarchaeota archaeon]|nr:hypothetical protein [Candidatus Bathyarchaeota archaeon]MBS7631152.1 hypothetical protein [Candidatus Bathyarchaeota archaeon]
MVNSLNNLTIIPSFISIVLGILIIAMGVFSAFLKFGVELIVDETGKLGIESRKLDLRAYNYSAPRNDIQTSKSESKDVTTKNIFKINRWGLISIILGLIMLVVAYYLYNLKGVLVNFYYLLEIGVFTLIGIILIVYGVYLTVFKK